MSDNSPRAVRLRLQEGIIEEVEQALNRVWLDAREVEDHLTVQIVGRIRDTLGHIHDRLDEEFATAPEEDR